MEKLARSHGSCEQASCLCSVTAHGRLLSGSVSHTAAILRWLRYTAESCAAMLEAVIVGDLDLLGLKGKSDVHPPTVR